jgi:hypothetical protein
MKLIYRSPYHRARIQAAIEVARTVSSGKRHADILIAAQAFIHDCGDSELVVAFQEIGTALGILAYLRRGIPALMASRSWHENQVAEQKRFIAERLKFLQEAGEI